MSLVFFLSGAAFLGFGIYFLSPKNMNGLADLSEDEKQKKNNLFTGKISGYISLIMGMLGIISGIIYLKFYDFIKIFLIIYLFVMMVCLLFLYFFIKINKHE